MEGLSIHYKRANVNRIIGNRSFDKRPWRGIPKEKEITTNFKTEWGA
jgi:hypothetical protein